MDWMGGPAVMDSPGGTTSPTCTVRRLLLGPQWGRSVVPGSSMERRISPPPASAREVASATASAAAAAAGHTP